MTGTFLRCPEHGSTLFESCALASGTDTDYIARKILPKTGSSVLESIPFVFATVSCHLDSFRDGVLAAVNAGGDTDSNAAMVGAILGALHGVSAIPPEWIDDVEEVDEIIIIADQLLELSHE